MKSAFSCNIKKIIKKALAGGLFILRYIKERKIDITDQSSISKIIKDFKPEIVFHLAAQPIVLQSYNFPIETIQTNILGTSHILEVCRHNNFVKSLIIITSDKVYKNFNDKKANPWILFKNSIARRRFVFYLCLLVTELGRKTM